MGTDWLFPLRVSQWSGNHRYINAMMHIRVASAAVEQVPGGRRETDPLWWQTSKVAMYMPMCISRNSLRATLRSADIPLNVA